MHSLDHVHVELEPDVQAEQAQVEALTNLTLDQGAPVHPTKILDFYFKSILYAKFACALSCRN
jgi:hypothetical protein